MKIIILGVEKKYYQMLSRIIFYLTIDMAQYLTFKHNTRYFKRCSNLMISTNLTTFPTCKNAKNYGKII